ncbi:MAG: hypothetical protein U0805_08800 [Pirellulales bacterium]
MQDSIAILIALAALAFLVRRGWQSLTARRAGKCGACTNCPANAATASLVRISPPNK